MHLKLSPGTMSMHVGDSQITPKYLGCFITLMTAKLLDSRLAVIYYFVLCLCKRCRLVVVHCQL
jgi:hypothetical protein